ncbi:MAG: RraA family protein [Ignavibacteriaceae bacterium]
MTKEIKPLIKGQKIIGRAFTLNERHAICMNILKEIRNGEVLVVAGRDPLEHGGIGSGLRHWLKERGVAGVVIDGGAHDTQNIQLEGFNVFCRYTVPTHGITKWRGVTQVPIKCGGVDVSPGDLIIGDDDGVVVIPNGNEEKVVKELELSKQANEYLEENLKKGVDLWDIKGLEEMWTKKEEMGIYQWQVYKTWNKKYIDNYDYKKSQ